MPQTRSNFKGSTIVVRSDGRLSENGRDSGFSGSFSIETEHPTKPTSQTFVDVVLNTFARAEANALMLARRKVDSEEAGLHSPRPKCA